MPFDSSDVDPVVEVNAAITTGLLAVGGVLATGHKYMHTLSKLSKENPKELAGAFVATAYYFVYNTAALYLTASNESLLECMMRHSLGECVSESP
jgi:hypothetical protein